MASDGSAKVGAGAGRAGVLSAAAGSIAVASATFIGVTSFTSFNPPDWVRPPLMLAFPLALVIAVLLGIAGLRRPRRAWSIIGLALCVAAVGAFAVFIVLGE